MLFDSALLAQFLATMMVLQLLFVLLNLTVQLVGQNVDGSVEILVDRLDVNVLAGQMHGDLGLLLQFFHRLDHVHVDDMIEMTCNPLELAGNVITQRRGDFEMVSTDLQVHGVAPFKRIAAAATVEIPLAHSRERDWG